MGKVVFAFNKPTNLALLYIIKITYGTDTIKTHFLRPIILEEFIFLIRIYIVKI